MIIITFNSFFQVKSISNCGKLDITTSSSPFFPSICGVDLPSFESRPVCWKMTDLREIRGPPPPASVDHQTWGTEVILDSAGLMQLLSHSGQTGARVAQLTIFQYLEHVNGCCCLAAKWCPNLHPQGLSSVHGIIQARTLEWVAICFSRGSSQPWAQSCTCCTVGRFLTTVPRGKLDLLHAT